MESHITVRAPKQYLEAAIDTQSEEELKKMVAQHILYEVALPTLAKEYD